MEKSNSVDQRLAAVRQFLASRPALFARQGAVVTTWRTVGQRRLGPYYALRYRDAGRQQSLYLGSSSTLAEQVGQLLEQAQRPRREQVALQHARAAARAALRSHKQLWQRDLERAGLTLKGFVIRNLKNLQAIDPHDQPRQMRPVGDSPIVHRLLSSMLPSTRGLSLFGRPLL